MENRKELAVIFMGSTKDASWTEGIQEVFDEFNLAYEIRALSAHKTPKKVLQALEEYEKREEKIVYIAVAGKSNALGPVLSANSRRPVINCPPLGSFKEDVYSSLRTPSGVPCSTILEPKNAALHAIKIFSLFDKELKEKLAKWQIHQREKLIDEDEQLSSI